MATPAPSTRGRTSAGRRRPPVLLGRDRLLEQLGQAVEEAAAGHGQTILLTGDPGIGKTALAAALRSQAQATGARVLWGSALPDEALDYWPWVQVVWALVKDDPDGSRSSTARTSASLPDLVAGATPGRAPRKSDRQALFDATASLLIDRAKDRPLVVVLDDLHRADPPTLGFLEFLAPRVGAARVLVIGTSSADAPPSIATVLPLAALTASEVGQVMTNLLGEEPAADLAAAVMRRTGGNPFLVQQVTWALEAQDGEPSQPHLATLPADPLTAIEGRLAHLSGEANEVLAVAAVLGSTFTAPRVAGVTGHPVPDLRRMLGEAVRAHLLLGADGPLGTYAFQHDLIRDAVLARFAEPELARIHVAVGESLARARERGADIAPGELARHLAYGVGQGVEAEVIRYSIEAARDATGRMAHHEAVRHWQRARATLEAHPDARGPSLANILVELDDAQRRLANDIAPPADAESVRHTEDDLP